MAGRHGKFLVTSLQFGHWKNGSNYFGFAPDKISTVDSPSGITTGDTINEGNHNRENRYHTKGTVSWYKPDWLGGNHALKSGFDYSVADGNRPWDSRGTAGNYQQMLRSGAAFQIGVWNYPVTPANTDPLPWDLRSGQLDDQSASHAESRTALCARQRFSAGAVPRRR